MPDEDTEHGFDKDTMFIINGTYQKQEDNDTGTYSFTAENVVLDFQNVAGSDDPPDPPTEERLEGLRLLGIEPTPIGKGANKKSKFLDKITLEKVKLVAIMRPPSPPSPP